MKTAVITFHNTSNFGATLQCAALMRRLSSMGQEVEVINYLPYYVLDKKSVFRELKKAGKARNKARALIKGAAYLAHAGEFSGRDRCFERFIRQNLPLTRVYHTYESLLQDPPRADLYICGSDQIWNPALTGGMPDRAFFLQFTDGKRAAYGASLGEYDIEGNAAELAALTEGFAGVSVREKSAAEKLSLAIGREVPAVLDCTLLLGKEDYRDMESTDFKAGAPYLLLYNIQNSEQSVRIAKKTAREKGLRIVDISPNPFVRVRGTRKEIAIGPDRFLSLVKNAQFVVTNSFHGTAFSIIYEKPFIAIAHSTRGGRTRDLLEAAGLEDRLAENPDTIPREEINYQEAGRRLAILRQESVRYLEEISS
ncbi:MAG: polysaccharide pyruvyl transferase family protein [Eubacteriales bacterium]|nr:polysaccharide pyruvyl transferase family protein [Eubacteriales bacterium]